MTNVNIQYIPTKWDCRKEGGGAITDQRAGHLRFDQPQLKSEVV